MSFLQPAEQVCRDVTGAQSPPLLALLPLHSGQREVLQYLWACLQHSKALTGFSALQLDEGSQPTCSKHICASWQQNRDLARPQCPLQDPGGCFS